MRYSITRMVCTLAGVLIFLTMACTSPAGTETKTPVYTITITDSKNGTVSAEQKTAKEGDVVLFTVVPDEQYVIASMNVKGISGAVYKILGCRLVMPAEDVIITVIFAPETTDEEENKDKDQDKNKDIDTESEAKNEGISSEIIPRYEVNVTDVLSNGNVTIISGIETEDGIAKARAGDTITVTAGADSGYKLSGEGLTLTPPDAVILDVPEDGEGVWTFVMPDTNLEIGADFVEMGPLDIFKGGVRKGISIGVLPENEKSYVVDMEAEVPGRNGVRRVIKISPSLKDNGNAMHQSFGLYSDTEINLDKAAALSFWAKANKTLNIKYVGFGDNDSRKRIVYTGEENNQLIAIGTEWKRYIVPVPAADSGQTAVRCFFLYADLRPGNNIYIDNIEFIETGVTLTEIIIPDAYNEPWYGEFDPAAVLMQIPLKLIYTCDDGTIVTLHTVNSNHLLKYKLAHWLIPFINGNTSTFSVRVAGINSNTMSINAAGDSEGLVLDDFEFPESDKDIAFKGDPKSEAGGRWYTNGSGKQVFREHIAQQSNEIYHGLGSGTWRYSNKEGVNQRGGRNFEAIDAGSNDTLSFHVKVINVSEAETVPAKNTVFTFELRNGGTLDKKNSGVFFSRPFTFNADDWQEFTIPLSAFANNEDKLDITAITAYAFSVVDSQGMSLRIMLDDIVLRKAP